MIVNYSTANAAAQASVIWVQSWAWSLHVLHMTDFLSGFLSSQNATLENKLAIVNCRSMLHGNEGQGIVDELCG